MKYFLVEGTLKTKDPVEDTIMESHIQYSKKAMEKGLFLMSGLKEDMSGALYVMQAEEEQQIREYLEQDPLKVNGIQEYRIIEFMPHYINKSKMG